MTFYFFESSPSSRKGAGITWSKTTAMPEFRIVAPGEKMPFPIDADLFPLGPLPQDVRDEMSNLWALTVVRNTKLPDWFNSLAQHHFNGLQAVNEKIAEVYRQFGGEGMEILHIPKMWSIKENAPGAQPYYLVNVYDAEETLDLARCEAYPVKNPRLAPFYKWGVSGSSMSHLQMRKGFVPSRHVWRDSNTSHWFCDDAFRAALEKASRASYLFHEVKTGNLLKSNQN